MTEISVRASSLTEWPDCERRFAARHLADMVKAAGYDLRAVPGTIGAKVGTALHSGAAHMLTHKMKTGELSLEKEAIEVGIESLKRGLAESGGVLWDDTSPTVDAAEKQTARMVRAYQVFIAPQLRPTAVEHEMRARFNERIVVTGHLDEAEDNEVNDTKSGVMRRPNHPQYGCYSMLRRASGNPVARFNEHYVPRNSLKQPQKMPEIHAYAVGTCEQAAHAVLGRIDDAVQKFRKSGDNWAFLANPASMLCGNKYCPAFQTSWCRSHK